MFAGINYIENQDGVLSGMRSKENETVPFTETIDIKEYKKINKWLD